MKLEEALTLMTHCREEAAAGRAFYEQERQKAAQRRDEARDDPIPWSNARIALNDAESALSDIPAGFWVASKDGERFFVLYQYDADEYYDSRLGMASTTEDWEMQQTAWRPRWLEAASPRSRC